MFPAHLLDYMSIVKHTGTSYKVGPSSRESCLLSPSGRIGGEFMQLRAHLLADPCTYLVQGPSYLSCLMLLIGFEYFDKSRKGFWTPIHCNFQYMIDGLASENRIVYHILLHELASGSAAD